MYSIKELEKTEFLVLRNQIRLQERERSYFFQLKSVYVVHCYVNSTNLFFFTVESKEFSSTLTVLTAALLFEIGMKFRSKTLNKHNLLSKQNCKCSQLLVFFFFYGTRLNYSAGMLWNVQSSLLTERNFETYPSKAAFWTACNTHQQAFKDRIRDWVSLSIDRSHESQTTHRETRKAGRTSVAVS